MNSTHPFYELGVIYDDRVIPEFLNQNAYTGVSYVSWYMRRGEVEVTSAGKRLRARKGDWVFKDPLTVKSHRFSCDAQIVSIRFRMDWQGLHFLPPLREPCIYSGAQKEQLLDAAEALCQVSKQDFANATMMLSDHAQLSARLADWLHYWHLAREESYADTAYPMNRRIYEIISVLGEDIGISPVDYSKLSRVVGLSRAQINRIFKQSTDLTPKQWKEASCLKSAEQLLRSDLLSIKEIAAQLGFSDGSHFTKWFRGKMNQTPSQWLRMQRRQESSSEWYKAPN
ncbi:AraC family transcriptional regulator [Rubellicoccus peritrichatus]|uniref:AraC family transcriptional regulator n=1 Tax=Rubellicoccus peritrichatus TaxID=3080537 RepID=A0AAQ3QQC3_9BACT|nr:AraC family transcriptional regulator [Puniceicoccus sp. CR14]WOO40088.1 AraC family transcriptional regulator [Puniceicoccus sp. CR14]